MTSPHILVVVDNPSTLSDLRTSLSRKACTSEFVRGAEDVLRRVHRDPTPDLLLFELNGKASDLDTLRDIFHLRPELKVVVVSGSDSTRKIVEAIQLGAKDYITTPVGDAELEWIIRRHLNDPRTPGNEAKYPDSAEDLGDGRFFVTGSPAMQKLRTQLTVLATIDVPVLILGESGTGKEIAARLIHKLSPRSGQRFLKVNCAALPGELLESELFGYERGAFTGAIRKKPGQFELCEKGTILLDEVGEMPPQLQPKLLHVLQDKQFFRLGGQRTIDVDVRILAATNINVGEAIADRRLREDLYYRLSAFAIFLPPLRERREEIATLLQHFMARMAAQYSRPLLAFSRSLVDACLNYSWPGNLRELENFVKRYLVMGDEAIAIAELCHASGNKHTIFLGSMPVATPPKLEPPPETGDQGSRNLKSIVKNLTDEAEMQAIKQALQETSWNRKRAARLLNISYRSLLYKICEYGITRESVREVCVNHGSNGR